MRREFRGACHHCPMTPLVPVILSGGAGTRLWPASREAHPKQFLPLAGDDSLLQRTWLRVAGVPGAAAPLVVGNEDHRFLIAEQLRAAGARPGPASRPSIVLEPVARNTAPAIAAAALVASADGSDPLLLVLPSDHLIGDEPAFRAAIDAARVAADDGALVTFGIVPDAPETGFGYIKAAKGEGVRAVDRFVEKPDAATARAYVDSGEYYWNSGMFLFRASRLIEELGATRPAILAAARAAVAAARRDADFLRLDKDAFARSPSESIDYAVMEHTRRAAVVPMAARWSDVGSWSALWQVSERDADGNALQGDVLALGTRNTLAHAPRRLVALLGVEDLVVVDTEDALLVAHRDGVQQVKDIVAKLKADGRGQANTHTRVFRPWGNYETVDAGERFQVKRIVVKPGASLSLQMHHHRAEHWVVVKGTARVTCDERVFDLQENQSTFIPLGSRHRLENATDAPLEIIEVQSGGYLGEDDIVRFEDAYGR
jgi:mannose-1-phosphate guanylyltransferase/mannose-6-phosphate isomerase